MANEVGIGIDWEKFLGKGMVIISDAAANVAHLRCKQCREDVLTFDPQFPRFREKPKGFDSGAALKEYELTEGIYGGIDHAAILNARNVAIEHRALVHSEMTMDAALMLIDRALKECFPDRHHEIARVVAKKFDVARAALREIANEPTNVDFTRLRLLASRALKEMGGVE